MRILVGGRVLFRSRCACVKGKMYKAHIIFISIRCRFLKCGLCSVNMAKIAYAKRAHVLNESPAQHKITRGALSNCDWCISGKWLGLRDMCARREPFFANSCQRCIEHKEHDLIYISVCVRCELWPSCADLSHFSHLLKCLWNVFRHTDAHTKESCQQKSQPLSAKYN
jgi:hypothetical protein